MDYIFLEGQEVTAADARSLAAAFDRALAAIPEGDTIKPSVGIDPLLEYYTGPNRRQVADFAEYCRAGAFRVWENGDIARFGLPTRTEGDHP